MYDKVLNLVQKGFSIKKSLKILGVSSSSNFYKTITEKQKQSLRHSKYINYPYFYFDESLSEQLKKCATRISLIDKNNI